MTKTKSQIKAEKVDRALRDIWGSLESHLYFTHHPSREGMRFHRKCVKDYAQQIANIVKI